MTDDLPTPPLPEATAMTWVRESGAGEWNLALRLAAFEKFPQCARCSSDITPSSTSDRGHSGHGQRPPPLRRAAAVSRIGQPGDSEQHAYSRAARRRPPAMSSTMPRSVIGRRISGSSTRCSASRICGSAGCSAVEVAEDWLDW